jgi:natural product precursor
MNMKSLKLNIVESCKLTQKEMNCIKGGGWTCSCSCYYAESGGASIEANGDANLTTPGGLESEKGDCKWSGVVVTP